MDIRYDHACQLFAKVLFMLICLNVSFKAVTCDAMVIGLINNFKLVEIRLFIKRTITNNFVRFQFYASDVWGFLK